MIRYRDRILSQRLNGQGSSAKAAFCLQNNSDDILSVKNISTRLAGPDDSCFLEALFFDVRSEELEAAGLSSEQIELLLSIQFDSQTQSYKSRFPDAESYIIQENDKPIGRLLIEPGENKIHIIDISVLRNFRGKGVGSVTLNVLKQRSEHITLMVISTNDRAFSLYKKLDFSLTADLGSFFEMEWRRE